MSPGPRPELTEDDLRRAYIQAFERRRHEAALRDVRIKVNPATMAASTTPITREELESFADLEDHLDADPSPAFKPFDFTIPEDHNLGDVVRRCQDRLPREGAAPYEFRIGRVGGRDSTSWKISELSNGTLASSILIGVDEVGPYPELEVRVATARPPGYAEEGRARRMFGRMGR